MSVGRVLTQAEQQPEKLSESLEINRHNTVLMFYGGIKNIVNGRSLIKYTNDKKRLERQIRKN